MLMESPSLLKGIQPQLTKYVQTLNSILEVDIEVVDSALVRIAGTGIYQNALDINIEDEGHLYASVFRTKRELIVKDILHHPICSKCDKKEFCANKLLIVVPIFYSGDAVGVIGIVSTDYDRKNYIRQRLRQYLEFVHHISDLISSKITENQNELIEKNKLGIWMDIINLIEKGVMILDDTGKIVYVNHIARQQLGISSNEKEKEITFSLLTIENITENHDRMTIQVENRCHTVIGKMIAIHSFMSNYDKLIIIDRPDTRALPEIKKTPSLTPPPFEEPPQFIIGTSAQMLEIQKRIKRIAASTSTVLISGESGTGKEMIAREIHLHSNRKGKPFVAVNCGAIPENLLESEFFGYVKGAFTGANLSGKLGKFELANTGILFLDEIGDMPLHLQVKILRVLQEKRFYRVGSNKVIELDIKIIAATNKNLKQMCETGQFRTDLYYRLNVIPIEIPPLRERKDDILDLFHYFVYKYSERFGLQNINVTQSTLDCLCEYDWVGNVRELENAVEYALNLVDQGGTITCDILPDHVRQGSVLQSLPKLPTPQLKKELPSQDILNGIIPLEKLEQDYILLLLEKYGDNTQSKKRIAKELGIGVATLYRKLHAVTPQ